MYPSDPGEPRDPLRSSDSLHPSNPQAPEDISSSRRTDRYVRRTAEPTIQRRINRRTGETSIDGPGAARRGSHARPPLKSGTPSRLAAIAVLLAVIAVFAIAALVATSGSDAAPGTGETVPVSVLPITPEYLKEGAATSTTEYPETPVNGETPVSEPGAGEEEDGGGGTTTPTAGD